MTWAQTDQDAPCRSWLRWQAACRCCYSSQGSECREYCVVYRRLQRSRSSLPACNIIIARIVSNINNRRTCWLSIMSISWSLYEKTEGPDNWHAMRWCVRIVTNKKFLYYLPFQSERCRVRPGRELEAFAHFSVFCTQINQRQTALHGILWALSN